MSMLRGTLSFLLMLVVAGLGSVSAQDGKPAGEADVEKAKAEPDAAAKADDKDKDKDKKAEPAKPKIELATFGGGCFWCTEAVFERLSGVKSVVSGYSGGNVANPTYEMISTGLTGHAEVIQIQYDANIISFEKLLDLFWHAHDPTTVDSQGPDFGPQYRSIILYHSEAQKEAAEKSKHDQNVKRARRSPVVTEIVPFEAFYPAEEYHQDYARNHRGNGYVETYITPKLRKLKPLLK